MAAPTTAQVGDKQNGQRHSPILWFLPVVLEKAEAAIACAALMACKVAPVANKDGRILARRAGFIKGFISYLDLQTAESYGQGQYVGYLLAFPLIDLLVTSYSSEFISLDNDRNNNIISSRCQIRKQETLLGEILF